MEAKDVNCPLNLWPKISWEIIQNKGKNSKYRNYFFTVSTSVRTFWEVTKWLFSMLWMWNEVFVPSVEVKLDVVLLDADWAKGKAGDMKKTFKANNWVTITITIDYIDFGTIAPYIMFICLYHWVGNNSVCL
jgi:hypothetical protein